MYVSRYALHISGNIQFSLQDLYFFYMWKWYRNKSRRKIMVRRWGRKGISFLQHTKIDNNIQFLYYYYFFNFLFLLLLLLSASAAAGTADTHHHIFLILNFLFRFEFFIRQRRKKKKTEKIWKLKTQFMRNLIFTWTNWQKHCYNSDWDVMYVRGKTRKEWWKCFSFSPFVFFIFPIISVEKKIKNEMNLRKMYTSTRLAREHYTDYTLRW